MAEPKSDKLVTIVRFYPGEPNIGNDMKGPRELKRYVAKHREYIKAARGDLLILFKLNDTCKKWYKRRKRPTNAEMEE